MVEFGFSGFAADMLATTSVPAEVEEEQKLASATSLATALRPVRAPYPGLNGQRKQRRVARPRGAAFNSLTFSLGSTCSRWKILEGLYQGIFF